MKKQKVRYIMVNVASVVPEFGIDKMLTAEEVLKSNQRLRLEGSNYRYIPYAEYGEYIKNN